MPKNKWINIRCTEQERAEINEIAARHNMSVSQLFFMLLAQLKQEERIQKVEAASKFLAMVMGVSEDNRKAWTEQTIKNFQEGGIDENDKHSTKP